MRKFQIGFAAISLVFLVAVQAVFLNFVGDPEMTGPSMEIVIDDSSVDSLGNPMSTPWAIVPAPSGNVYVLSNNNNVFRIDPSGVVTAVLDQDGVGGIPFQQHQQMVMDAFENVYVLDFAETRVIRIQPDDTVDVVLDSTGDGQGATLAGAAGIAVAPDGSVYVGGEDSYNVFRLVAEPSGVVNISDVFDVNVRPTDIAVDDAGYMYVSSGPLGDLYRIDPADPQKVTGKFYRMGDTVHQMAVDKNRVVHVAGRAGSYARYARVPMVGSAGLLGGEAHSIGAYSLAMDAQQNVIVPFFRGAVHRIRRDGAMSEYLSHEYIVNALGIPEPAFTFSNAIDDAGGLYLGFEDRVIRLQAGCSDGLDNDGDEFADFPLDPGCQGPLQTIEDPACDDGIDNDGDGAIDTLDTGCRTSWGIREESWGRCGVGFELALFLPLISLATRKRQRARRRQG